MCKEVEGIQYKIEETFAVEASWQLAYLHVELM